MKPLVVIPARGGSKRLPGKNIKPLNGKPLIHYTIESAREVFSDHQICVSTDDEKIKECAERTGLSVPFMRPGELARDDSGSREVLLHAVSYYRERGYDADTVILLQPTSPFRTGSHIKEAIWLFTEDLDMVVSVKKTKSNPYKVLFEENDAGLLVKSKELNSDEKHVTPTVWELNGAIYIIKRLSLTRQSIKSFKKVKKFVMSEWASIDIDTEFDWNMAEMIMEKKINLSNFHN